MEALSPTPKPAVAASERPTVVGFKRFSMTITESVGGRKITVTILGKEGAKIAFAREDDERLYVVSLDRLSRSDQETLAAVSDGADVVLRKIEMGLYRRVSDLPIAAP